MHPGPGRPRGSRKSLAVAVLLAIALGLGAGVLLVRPDVEEPAAATPTVKSSRPLTPFEQAQTVLEKQAAAYLKGDEKGWLAAVDSTLTTKYRMIYRNLRGLEVSHVEYHTYPAETKAADGAVNIDADLAYCFSGAACPEWRSSADDGPPREFQTVTLTLRDGRYVITKFVGGNTDQYLSPTPWESQTLTIAKGKRVIVAAPKSQAKNVKTVLRQAELAAAVADRYAGYIDNRQKAKYRVYLADEKAWKTWYGGFDADWAIGYTVPLNAAGSDVLLHSSEVLGSTRQLRVIVQHELAHVATLAGLTQRDTGDDQWLIEGIAEYIGAYPRQPQATGNHDVLAESFSKRGAPKTIAVPSLADDADDLTVNTLYAMGHYAAACMADKYGERKLLTFTALVLREAKKPDEASRSAFGKPFSTVDKGCLTWIKARV
ncbi:hypothetical protein [Actinoplanes sp. NPDC051851]|uniref:hypothetical protein n=1 Tax=Actinoplanes sp. NPDC051851 TaxID=3154753 RepID=UPI003433BE1A